MSDNLRDRIEKAAQRHAESSSRLGENAEPEVPKSESLRDRIAAGITDVDDWQGVTDPTILADAVIAELGLDEVLQDCRCRLRYLLNE